MLALLWLQPTAKIKHGLYQADKRDSGGFKLKGLCPEEQTKQACFCDWRSEPCERLYVSLQSAL
jgi:hypothetical protein